MRLLPVFALLALACGSTTAIAACGSTEDAGGAPPAATTAPTEPAPPAEEPAPAETAIAFPAPHAGLPQVESQGGPVLAAPKVVPIFFPGFGFRSEVIDYAGKIGQKGAYWKAVSAEYGVGALTSTAAIDIAEDPGATITDDQIQAWLKSRFDGTHPEFGTTPIAGAIYTLFYPPTTTIYLGDAPVPMDGGAPEGGGGGGGGSDGGPRQPRAQSSCRSFGGYHQDVRVNGVSFAYAVIPQCAKFGPLSGIDVVTGTSSHEWVEAATDPYPTTKPAYATVDADHLSWMFALGAGEVGDMCAQYDSSFYKDKDIGYFVQRSWSNAAAAAGKEPCVPALPNDPPYFNTSPRLKDDVDLSFGTTKGVTVPVGKSKTIQLDLFSSAPTSGPWTVAVGATGGQNATPPVTFTLDKTSGKNGDKINVTITSNAAASSRLGGTTFIVTSTLGSEKHYWAGVVGN